MGIEYFNEIRKQYEELENQMNTFLQNIDKVKTICVKKFGYSDEYQILVANEKLCLTTNTDELAVALGIKKRTISAAIKRFKGHYDPTAYAENRFKTKEDAEKCLEWLIAKSLSEKLGGK